MPVKLLISQAIVLPAFPKLVSAQLPCNEKRTTSAPKINNNSNDNLVKKYGLEKIQLPGNFQISVFAEVPEVKNNLQNHL